jgi:RNA polymerase sigma-70 factor (ECF subfamily)
VGEQALLKALMRAGLQGDDQAHKALLKEVAGHLRAYFRARLRHNPEETEELVQETLIAVHTRRDTYDPT